MKKRNFTILELLFVIIIMGVVMAIGIPAFNSMVNANKVPQAARMVSNAIAKARAEAVVSNRRVAILLPNSKNGDTVRDKYKNNTFAIVTLEKDEDIIDPEKLDEFKWIHLPGNTIISNISINPEHIRFDNKGQWLVDGDTKDYSIYDDSPADLIKIEDINDSVYEDIIVRKIEKDDLKELDAIVLNPDGMIAVDGNDTLYIFITEGHMDDDKFVPTNENENNANLPYNSMCLKINRFTGKVTYEDLYLND